MQVDVVRVFTRGTEGGNHLGIVDRLLDDAAMAAVAAEVGFSETIFLDPEEAEPHVRIFTPGAELPFAGHPLVGVAWWLARRGRADPTLVTGIGPVPTRTMPGGAAIGVRVDQPVTGGVAPPDGVGDARCSVVAMPLPYVVCEAATPGAVAAIEPDPAWEHVYVHAAGPDGTVRARFFAGGLGVTEDPATGSAAVALVATLVAAGRRAGSLTIHQGEEVGHPSRLEIAWADGTATLSGTVVAEDPIQIRRPDGPVRTSAP